jgi:hypothetical protein
MCYPTDQSLGFKSERGAAATATRGSRIMRGSTGLASTNHPPRPLDLFLQAWRLKAGTILKHSMHFAVVCGEGDFIGPTFVSLHVR